MKKFIGLFIIITTLYSSAVYSQALYLDLVYEDSQSSLPKDSNWIKKLFSDQSRKVFLVVSVFKKNGSDANNFLIVPPKVVESFERSNGDIKRTKEANMNLLSSQFINSSEQLLLKVEFFSVSNTKASAFTESLRSLASAYTSAGGTPAASSVVTSAMNAIGSVLSNNKEVYLSHVSGIDPSTTTLSLYFDDNGNINDSPFDNGDISKKVVFNVSAKPNFIVDFEFSFENQGMNQAEKLAFQNLSEATTSIAKRTACRALRTTLRKRFSDTTTNDLLAIAINDIDWPQDETQYHCIAPTEAVRYKRQHGLNALANCTSDECTKTKTTLILLEGNAPTSVISKVTETDVYSLDCKTSTQFSRLYRWSTIKSSYQNEGFKSFTAKSCLTTASGTALYLHKFSWLEGDLATHSCDISTEENSCN